MLAGHESPSYSWLVWIPSSEPDGYESPSGTLVIVLLPVTVPACGGKGGHDCNDCDPHPAGLQCVPAGWESSPRLRGSAGANGAEVPLTHSNLHLMV